MSNFPSFTQRAHVLHHPERIPNRPPIERMAAVISVEQEDYNVFTASILDLVTGDVRAKQSYTDLTASIAPSPSGTVIAIATAKGVRVHNRADARCAWLLLLLLLLPLLLLLLLLLSDSKSHIHYCHRP